MKSTNRGIVAFLFLMAFSFALKAAELPDFTKLVKQSSPAVVNISTTKSNGGEGLGGYAPDLPEDHPLRDWFDRFLERSPQGAPAQPSASLGSGFIISKDGYVLTNHHVVEGADEIVVKLSDKRQLIAEYVGSDKRTDVALLKLDAKNLPTVGLGDSSKLEVGEWVLAIGSPFGFEHSVTAGIVSAKGRSLPNGQYVPFIQTDVAINPGNSGGPLFNLEGEVIGINSQIYSRTGGFMGLSFAIPIELAMNIADQIRTKGSVTRGWLGVVIQDVDRELAESFGMDRPNGALVAQVVEDSPADGKLKVGDVIVKFDGKEVSRSSALPPIVGSTKAGETVDVVVIRNKKRQTVEITVEALPDNLSSSPKGSNKKPRVNQDLKISVANLSEDMRKELGIDHGVAVQNVVGEAAKKAGIRRGDVITMLDGKEIKNINDFNDAAREAPKNKAFAILVRRQGETRFLAINLSEEE